jgi:hypothetical protein
MMPRHLGYTTGVIIMPLDRQKQRQQCVHDILHTIGMLIIYSTTSVHFIKVSC